MIENENMVSMAGGRVALLQKIRKSIASGELSIGEALPAERSIMEIHGEGRSTVRWALEQLQREGIIKQISPRTRIVSRVPVLPLGQSGASLDTLEDTLSDTVAVLAGEGGEEPRPGLSVPGWGFYVGHGAMSELHAAGCHVMRINRACLSDAEIARLVRSGIRAVILPEFSHSLYDAAEKLRKAGVIVVMAGDREDSKSFDRVSSDHAAGAGAEVKWLVEQGRRKIVQILADDWEKSYWQRGRRAGYEKAMRESGLEPLPPLLVHPSAHEAGGEKSSVGLEREARFLAGYFVQAFVAQRPDALLLFSDETVAPAALACRFCGVEPGDSVLLAGYDDFWSDHWSQKIYPFAPQVTVDKHNWDMGREMARLALERHAGTLPDSPQIRTVTPSLVPVLLKSAPENLGRPNDVQRSVSESSSTRQHVVVAGF